jgi:hypothetical protein
VGRYWTRGSLEICDSQSVDFARTSSSAFCETRNSTISACPSAAAHISADWSRYVSRVFTLAPCWTSSFATATVPVRAASISGVWPSSFDTLGLAPASSSMPARSRSAMRAASVSGLAPYLLTTSAFAPRRRSAVTSSRSTR